MMQTKYLDLPVEFMIDKGKDPVATRVPVYKTLLTSGKVYSTRKDINPSDVKILLISSNTHLDKSKGEKVKVELDDRVDLGIDLPTVDDIDNPPGKTEIDEIAGIINSVKDNNPHANITVDPRHTHQIDYQTFKTLVAKNEYNIIHYNGHGYFDSEDPKKNYIFFWEDKNKIGEKVVAVSHNELNGLLAGKTNLQFVYLSCCRGAAADTNYKGFYNYTGMLDAITAAGVPNVLGMRWPIATIDAKRFAQNFYYNLFKNGCTAEVALLKSRKAALHYDDHTVWCSPVLVKQEF